MYARNHKQKMKELHRKWRVKRIEWFNDLKKELSCLRCGIKDYRCLDFHHRDPKQKKFDISRKHVKTSNNEIILEEMKKCDVLCSNCHRITHYKIILPDTKS